MKDFTKEAIEEVINQAKNGMVKIGPNEESSRLFLTRFNTKIEGVLNANNSKVPTIEIPNYEQFLNTVESYLDRAKKFYYLDKYYFELDEKSFIQKLFLDLTTSCTNYDLSNFTQFVEEREALISNPIKTGTYELGNFNGYNMLFTISKNNSNLEAPYNFTIYFGDKKNNFKLPSVHFGIGNGKAKIMAIQGDKHKQTNEISKKLDRYFRKVNKGIDENSFEANVSPNALVALTLFNSYLKQNGITEIEAPVFMPIRYNANRITGAELASKVEWFELVGKEDVMKYFKEKSKKNRTEFYEKHDRDQFNITNKFTYLFFRYCKHFTNSKCNFNEITEKVETKLSLQQQPTDNIIFDLDKSVKPNFLFNKPKEL